MALKILLHIGPHKSGTTYLQHVLSDAYNSIHAGDPWYPSPDNHGPGHAELAWELLGLNGMKKSSNTVQKIIGKAKNNNVRQLLLSSEEFSRADLQGWYELREDFLHEELYVFITYSPVAKRVTSLWQESVKQGYVKNLHDSKDFIFSNKGLDPYFAKNMLEGLRPQGLKILIMPYYLSDNNLVKTSSEIILDKNRKILSDDLKISDFNKNKSLGYIECQCLLKFNEIYFQNNVDISKYILLRTKMLHIFNTVEWKKQCPYIPLVPPKCWQSKIDEYAHETMDALSPLVKSGIVSISGNIDDLSDKPKDENQSTHYTVNKLATEVINRSIESILKEIQ